MASSRVPHPKTLFHLVPDNSFSEQALDEPSNAQFVSRSREGDPGLEVGYHVPSIVGGHVVTRLGRRGDLILSKSSAGNPVSGIHVSFEINPESRLLVLSVRSKRMESVTFRVCNADKMDEITGDGVLVYGQDYIVTVASYRFKLLWRSRHGKTMEALAGHGYEESMELLQNVDPTDQPTSPALSEALTWHNTRLATAGTLTVREAKGAARRYVARGSFGTVFSAIDSISGHKFAIKQIKVGNGEGDFERAMVSREVYIMKRMKHLVNLSVQPNIIEFLGQKNLDSSHPEIFMPLRDGELATLVKDVKNIKGDFSGVCHLVLKEMLCALDYLESEEVLHRDIKLDNILYTLLPGDDAPHYRFQLADFGQARYRSEAKDHCGTSCYGAPELHPAETRIFADQSCKLDVWSLFACMMACLTRFADFPPPATQYISHVRVLRRLLKKHPVLEPMARLHPDRRATAGRMHLMCFGASGLTTKIRKIPPLPEADDDDKFLSELGGLSFQRTQLRQRLGRLGDQLIQFKHGSPWLPRNLFGRPGREPLPRAGVGRPQPARQTLLPPQAGHAEKTPHTSSPMRARAGVVKNRGESRRARANPGGQAPVKVKDMLDAGQPAYKAYKKPPLGTREQQRTDDINPKQPADYVNVDDDSFNPHIPGAFVS